MSAAAIYLPAIYVTCAASVGLSVAAVTTQKWLFTVAAAWGLLTAFCFFNAYRHAKREAR